jgi:hypothetical protein
MTKRLVALPIAMLAIALFAPGIANAANFNTTLSISITPGGAGFKGKVGSPHGTCVPNRTVTLQRKASGGSSFTNIGTDKSASNGAWQINTTVQQNAQYKAVVSKKAVGGGTCLAKTSKTLTARQTKSSIVIGSLGNSFKGKLTSTTSCISGRTVNLQRKTPSQSTFLNVGSPDTSASNGTWEVATNPVANAQYRASVSGKTVGTDACMATKSTVTTARASNVTIVQGGSTNFHGNVNSVAACEANRTVTLQRKTIYETAFHNVASDATNSSGAWLVPTAVVSGASYRASVSAKQSGAISCLDDLSNTIVAS